MKALMIYSGVMFGIALFGLVILILSWFGGESGKVILVTNVYNERLWETVLLAIGVIGIPFLWRRR